MEILSHGRYLWIGELIYLCSVKKKIWKFHINYSISWECMEYNCFKHLFKILHVIDVGNVFNLFAFPSECNFSGRKFHLDLVEIIKGNAGKILEGSTKCKCVEFFA